MGYPSPLEEGSNQRIMARQQTRPALKVKLDDTHPFVTGAPLTGRVVIDLDKMLQPNSDFEVVGSLTLVENIQNLDVLPRATIRKRHMHKLFAVTMPISAHKNCCLLTENQSGDNNDAMDVDEEVKRVNKAKERKKARKMDVPFSVEVEGHMPATIQQTMKGILKARVTYSLQMAAIRRIQDGGNANDLVDEWIHLGCENNESSKWSVLGTVIAKSNKCNVSIHRKLNNVGPLYSDYEMIHTPHGWFRPQLDKTAISPGDSLVLRLEYESKRSVDVDRMDVQLKSFWSVQFVASDQNLARNSYWQSQEISLPILSRKEYKDGVNWVVELKTCIPQDIQPSWTSESSPDVIPCSPYSKDKGYVANYCYRLYVASPPWYYPCSLAITVASLIPPFTFFTHRPMDIFEAAKTGNMKLMRILLKHGQDPNEYKQPNWRKPQNEIVTLTDPPLHFACLHGHYLLAKLLLDYGASLTYKDKDHCDRGSSALHSVCKAISFHKGHLKLAKFLIEEKKIPINALYGYKSPIHCLCIGGLLPFTENRSDDEFEMRYAMVKLLLTHGAEINQRDAKGITPLLECLDKGLFTNVQTLLHFEADVNLPLKGNCFLLDDQPNSWSQLIEGSTALHIAVLMGSVPIVQALLRNDANISVQNIRGETPLHYACLAGDIPIIRLLLSSDQEEKAIQTPNTRGHTPLQLQSDRTKKMLAKRERQEFEQHMTKELLKNELCTQKNSKSGWQKKDLKMRRKGHTRATSLIPEDFTIVNLPFEVQLHVFSYLKIRDVLSLSQVCKQWYELGRDQQLWKRIYHQLFPSPYSQLQHGDFKWKVVSKLRENQFVIWRNKHMAPWNGQQHFNTKTEDEGPLSIKCMLKGDDGSGKTSLLRTFKQRKFSTESLQAPLNSPSCERGDIESLILINGEPATLNIVDTDNWRSSAIFLQWVDIVILCLPADEPDPVDRIKRAVDAVRYHSPNMPMVLCLTKIDLRDEEGKGRPAHRHRITYQEGALLAYHFGLCSYVEVSALKMRNVDKVFKEAAEVVLGKLSGEQQQKWKEKKSMEHKCFVQ